MNKAVKVTRKHDDSGNMYRPHQYNWDVKFEDGEIVEVADWGDGPVALGLFYQEGEEKAKKGNRAKNAVKKFMGWE
jgi:hypothetical protein